MAWGGNQSRSANGRTDGKVQAITSKSQRKDRQGDVKEFGEMNRLKCVDSNNMVWVKLRTWISAQNCVVVAFAET